MGELLVRSGQEALSQGRRLLHLLLLVTGVGGHRLARLLLVPVQPARAAVLLLLVVVQLTDRLEHEAAVAAPARGVNITDVFVQRDLGVVELAAVRAGLNLVRSVRSPLVVSQNSLRLVVKPAELAGDAVAAVDDALVAEQQSAGPEGSAALVTDHLLLLPRLPLLLRVTQDVAVRARLRVEYFPTLRTRMLFVTVEISRMYH